MPYASAMTSETVNQLQLIAIKNNEIKIKPQLEPIKERTGRVFCFFYYYYD